MCMSMLCLRRDQHEQWKCHQDKPSRSVKVCRCQLPCDNPFYSSEPPKKDSTDTPLASYVGSGNAVAFATGKVKILRYSVSAQFFGVILAPSLS
ncbi:hypothetical protein PRUPE_1G192100 [Prunus persica]|uniref:Uncharacterized protein n=1 Tax=Prunus persica TaxID=3760 RepID=A0A251QZX2_PRUPE|nr:hypothetical protein PRUPE_1G192100 [Prunus persica]